MNNPSWIRCRDIHAANGADIDWCVCHEPSKRHSYGALHFPSVCVLELGRHVEVVKILSTLRHLDSTNPLTAFKLDAGRIQLFCHHQKPNTTLTPAVPVLRPHLVAAWKDSFIALVSSPNTYYAVQMPLYKHTLPPIYHSPFTIYYLGLRWQRNLQPLPCGSLLCMFYVPPFLD